MLFDADRVGKIFNLREESAFVFLESRTLYNVLQSRTLYSVLQKRH